MNNLPKSYAQKGIAHILLIIIALVVILLLAVFLTLFFSKTPPKSYSLVTFDSKTVHLLSQGETLTGKTIPLSKIEVLITPGNLKKELDVNDKGEFTYALPDNLEPKEFRITFINSDKADKLISIKSYRFKVVSLGILNDLLNKFKPKPVQAQSENIENYAEWVTMMQSMGVYPKEEGEDIILYDRATFMDTYCLNDPCLFNPTPLNDLLKSAQDDKIFLVDLAAKLNSNGYFPAESLEPYFPGITEQILIGRGFPTIPGETTKTAIDEETLARLINETATDKGWFNDQYGDPLKLLVTTTDPILGTRAVVDYFSTPGNQLTEQQKVDFLLALTIFEGMPTKFLKGARGAIDLVKAQSLGKVVKNEIKQGAGVPLSAIEEEVEQGVYRYIPHKDDLVYNIDTLRTIYKDRPGINFPIGDNALAYFHEHKILDELLNKRAFILSSNEIDTIRGLVRDNWRDVQQRVGGGYFRDDFERALDRRQVYIVPKAVLGETAIAIDDAIFISTEIYHDNRFEYVLAHEINHGYAPPISDFKGFQFTTGDWQQPDGFLSDLVEFMADVRTVQAMHGSSFAYQASYFNAYPNLLFKLKNLEQKNPDLWKAFERFGLSADADEFISLASNNTQLRDFVRQKGYPEVSRENFQQIMDLYLSELMGINMSETKLHQEILNSAGKAIAVPALIYGPNFFTDENNQEEVTITSVQGDLAPGSKLDVQAAISQDGYELGPEQYRQVWALEKEGQNSSSIFLKTVHAQDDPQTVAGVDPLAGGNNCQEECTVSLPQNITPDRYNLVVYLTPVNSDEIISSDTYPINLGAPIPGGSESACTDEELEFAGCDESACGKEFWRCSKDGKVQSFENPTGDCSLKDGPNPACTETGRTTDVSPNVTDDEGNKVPFFAIQLGEDQEGNGEKLRREAVRRIAESEDYSQGLDYLAGITNDSEVKSLIEKAQGKVGASTKENNACIQQ